jgi:hypothetical protein
VITLLRSTAIGIFISLILLFDANAQQPMAWRQILQIGQGYESTNRIGEATRSYLHAYRTARTDAEKVESLELFGRLMVKIKNDQQASVTARRIIPLDPQNEWARNYMKVAGARSEEDRQSREPKSTDINLVRTRASSPIYGIKSGDDWKVAQKKHRFKLKEAGNCGGRTMLQVFEATTSGRTLTASVARNTVVRVDVSIPHAFGSNRDAAFKLIEERHGTPLVRKGNSFQYTPHAINDIPDVFVTVENGSYNVTIFNARAYVDVYKALRNCATEEQIASALNTVRKFVGTSSGGPRSASGGGGQWGALAIDANAGTRFGWSESYGSRDAASQRARSECNARGGQNCSVVLSFQGGCAAYAASQSNGRTFGWGQQSSEAAAKSRALSECSSRGPSCEIRAWSCN